jgi:hypothetical protein
LRLEPATQLAEYEIVGFIDAGGMGEVYRAHESAEAASETRLGLAERVFDVYLY